MVAAPRRYHVYRMATHLDPHPPLEATLARLVGSAMEDAAIQGLCRDGQIEFAAGRLRIHRPDWTLETATAFVRSLADRSQRCRPGPVPIPLTFNESRPHLCGTLGREIREHRMPIKGKHHEVNHALQAELEFRAVARRNKRLGQWLAAAMGLHGEAAEAYAKEIVHADLEKPGHDDLILKAMTDIAAKGVAIGEPALRAKMDELLRLARGEIEDEAGR